MPRVSAFASWACGKTAWSSVELMNVVGSGCQFRLTIDAGVKFLPSNRMLNALFPANVAAGVTSTSTGDVAGGRLAAWKVAEFTFWRSMVMLITDGTNCAPAFDAVTL